MKTPIILKIRMKTPNLNIPVKEMPPNTKVISHYSLAMGVSQEKHPQARYRLYIGHPDGQLVVLMGLGAVLRTIWSMVKIIFVRLWYWRGKSIGEKEF